MSELDRAIGLEEVNVPPRRRPRYILSRRQGAAFVVLGYILVVAVMAALLSALQGVQGVNDSRNIDATLIFAVVLAVPFGGALVIIFRRSKLPAWPS